MNKSELKLKLEAEGVSPSAYSLDGGLPFDAYCLDHTRDKSVWFVYYSERGQKNHLREFTSESDACNYFYEYVTTDVTVYISPKTAN